MIKKLARWVLRRLSDEDNHVAYLEKQVEQYARTIEQQYYQQDWFALRLAPEYELGKIGTPKERFMNGLADLTRQTGIGIAGCGCCDSPFLEKADLSDPMAGYVFKGVDEGHVQWCTPKEINEPGNEPITVYRGKQYGPRETSQEQGETEKEDGPVCGRGAEAPGQPEQGSR